jgi:hypothetical protein
MSKPNLSPAKARDQLWRVGNLSWLLDSNQKSLYQMFHENPAKVQTWLLARRSGKSYALCVLAIEYCLKVPNSVIKYVAPTKDQVERFILPIIDNDILSTGGCPLEIKPTYVTSKKQYEFTNGSVIQLCGSENKNIESIRGGFSHISIVDEAQDVTGLKNAIRSVLLPTTLTTKGKILISGTPPQDVDHEFVGYIERAEANNTLIKRTIYDCPRHTKEDIASILEEYGGEESEEFQREFLCKIVKSKTRSVLPEATDELLRDITKVWQRPPFYYAYTGMDVGGKDWTVVLFGYYDFLSAKIIIEDEYGVPGQDMNIYTLTKTIKEKEEALWTSEITNEFVKPKKRVSDHNLIVINEIKRLSGYKIHFDLADKREKMVNINKLRVLLDSEDIIINPKCVTLLRHLKNVKWASATNKDDFARCDADNSHYDAVDALLYFVKALEADKDKNPYPRDFKSPLRANDTFRVSNGNSGQISESSANAYKTMLNLKTQSNGGKTAWLKHLKGNK